MKLDFEETFVVTEDHIKLLKRAYVRKYTCEFGAPGIDCKRPYGNGDVISDILEILEIPANCFEGEYSENIYKFCQQIHNQVETALQIFLRTGSMETGIYHAKWPSGNWKREREDFTAKVVFRTKLNSPIGKFHPPSQQIKGNLVSVSVPSLSCVLKAWPDADILRVDYKKQPNKIYEEVV